MEAFWQGFEKQAADRETDRKSSVRQLFEAVPTMARVTRQNVESKVKKGLGTAPNAPSEPDQAAPSRLPQYAAIAGAGTGAGITGGIVGESLGQHYALRTERKHPEYIRLQKGVSDAFARMEAANKKEMALYGESSRLHDAYMRGLRNAPDRQALRDVLAAHEGPKQALNREFEAIRAEASRHLDEVSRLGKSRNDFVLGRTRRLGRLGAGLGALALGLPAAGLAYHLMRPKSAPAPESADQAAPTE